MAYGPLRRIYLARPLSALFLCLPGIIICTWYSWNAFGKFDRYRKWTGEDVSLSLEDFHIYLFDLLHQDLRRTFMDPPPDSSKIDHFSFHIKSKNLKALYRGANLEVKRPYIPAKLESGNAIKKVEVRLRGQQHWNLLGKQKSLKVKLPKGELLHGYRIFNLINEPTPMVVGEQIVLNLAQDKDVLTPRTDFVRVRINNSDLGVFHYETQPDESLLRMNKRMPGSIYSGNLPPSAKTKELWSDVHRWKKVAWRNDREKDDYRDLNRLLDQIRNASVAQFAEFARHEVDQKAFALFEILDIAFGGDQHDFRENHKYYFDPYRGYWEPIAWNFRGFKDDPQFNLVENPILLRLKMVPGYLTQRNQLLYKFLVKKGNVTSVRLHGLKILKRLSSELVTDPYWSAYRLLQRIDRFHRRMMRPMTLKRAVLVYESELMTYSKRHAYLVSELERNPLWIEVSAEGKPPLIPIQLLIDGQSGVRLDGFQATWPPQCQEVSWQVLRQGESISPISTDNRVDLDQTLDLIPAVKLTPHENPNPRRGKVRTDMVPMAYPFSIQSNCPPLAVEATGIQLSTGSRVRSRPATAHVLDRLPKQVLQPDQVPRFQAGEVSVHPWKLPTAQSETIVLGPGRVEIIETRVFHENQTVEVAPGTQIYLGPSASLLFYGPVFFKGTRIQPIVIDRLMSHKPWGGIALQGPGTAGSVIEHAIIRGGTVPEHRTIPYPGMVNIHDTRNITLRYGKFSRNQTSDDLIHIAYTKGLQVEDCVVEDAISDAWDLEFTKAVLKRLQVVKTGDDGLDLMSSEVELTDSSLISCKGNGISAGEQSDVTVRHSLIADAKVGVLVKNESTTELFRTLLFRNQTGVRVYSRTVRYEGDSKIKSDVLFIVDSLKRSIKRNDMKEDVLDLGMVQRRLHQKGLLDHLCEDVIGIQNWDQLVGWIDERTSAVVREK